MLDRDDVVRAAERIAGLVRRTPVLRLEAGDLGTGAPISLKLEQLQHTGSFKPRGAFNRVLAAGRPERLLAASGGNHGLAVAYVAARLGCAADVFVPTVASPVKVAGIRRLGARVHVGGDYYADAWAAGQAAAAADPEALVVHAYDQPEVAAGQGTVALELAEQEPGTTTVLVAVGGGGLLAGVVAACAGPGIRVVGVETAGCPTLASALDAGEPVDAPVGGVAADSLGARRLGATAFEQVRTHRVGSVVVPDEAVIEARRRLWGRLRLVAEPGGATALAALTSGAYRPAGDERVAVVVCGANTDPADLSG